MVRKNNVAFYLLILAVFVSFENICSSFLFNTKLGQEQGFAEPEIDDNVENNNHTTPFSPDAGQRRKRRQERRRKARARKFGNQTLVVIIGNFRGGEQAWQSLTRNVLDPNSADLAILIPEDDDIAKSSSLYERAKYVWTYQDYDDWGDAIDLINGTEWRSLIDYNRPKAAPSIFGGVKGEPGSGAIIFMLRWFLQNHIREQHLTDLYTTFVITRSDHYYQCRHNVSVLTVGQKVLWIPRGENNGGKTDRHLIVGSDNVLDALDVYPYYFENEWLRMRKYPALLNTENLLGLVWRGKHLHVRYHPRVMFTSAVKIDKTTYQTAKDPVPGVPGLFIKYPTEYNLTQETCPSVAVG